MATKGGANFPSGGGNGQSGTRFAYSPCMMPFLHSRYTVLVVDDDPSVLATYRRLLGRCGYRTLTQDDPTRMLESLNPASGADLLLLDYKMPGMDGLSLLAKLRQRECRARCILVSAYLNDEVRRKAELLGVDRVLEKPVDVGLLRSVLADLLPGN